MDSTDEGMTLQRIVLIAINLLVLATLAMPVMSQTANTYVVKPGDTLYQIARAHDLTVQELKKLNDLEGNIVRAGQVLRVRAAETVVGWNRPERRIITGAEDPPEPAPPADSLRVDSLRAVSPEATLPQSDTTGTAVYVVEEGDTFYTLAARLNMTVDSLARMNGDLSGVMAAGTRLHVPLEKTYQQYRVRRGDTLFDLARKYGIRITDLSAANGLSSSRLRVGQNLRIPGQGVRAAANERDLLPDVAGTAVAVVYPTTYIGRMTAGGRSYDPARFTISHPDLDLGTIVLLTVRETGDETFAEVTDRGFFSDPMLIDVSESVARILNVDIQNGTRIEIRVIEGTGR